MAPIDSCPYRRPFAEIFADCPGYEPEIFASTNMRGLPLAPVWTCQNLSVGEVDGQKGHLYPRCVIGDAVARRAALFRKLRGPRAA
jgi:hypothetical protein